jgi:hypothetical protein
MPETREFGNFWHFPVDVKAENRLFSGFRGSTPVPRVKRLLDTRAKINMKIFQVLLCLFGGVILSTTRVRANVYATDIKLNGSLSTITNASLSPTTISYRLNQAATLGVTVSIWQGTNQVATINGGTKMGLNTVVWGGTNNSGGAVGSGAFSVSITAATLGFTNWQQISVDTNAGNYAFYPNGMAVDKNTNSPYYGRVVVGCSDSDGTSVNPISGDIILDGIYKMNADGSFADEGGFGYGGYTNDDFGDVSSNEMPSASFVVPWMLRIGEDDRIYMLDYSDEGAISSFDMEVTSFKIVIDDGGADFGKLGGPHNYSRNPYLTTLAYGIGEFDVTFPNSTNGAIWLCDNDNNKLVNPPNWGVMMYHLVNGQSDTNDTIGVQAVAVGGDLSLVSSGGCSVDSNLDIFVSQSSPQEGNLYYTMVFTNWNAGILPPESTSTNSLGPVAYALGTTTNQVEWGYGCGVDTMCGTNPTFEAIADTVINSRRNPTMVAYPMEAGSDEASGSGIRLLSAIDGSVIQTNIDFGQEYTCAAWDNVGNLYGASSTRNVWRVWSPPGPSTNTTVSVAQVIVSGALFQIGNASVVVTGPGSGNVTINFSAPGNPAPSTFTLVSSPSLLGTFTPVSGAVITGGSGAYQATFTASSTQFYEIKSGP